MNSMISIFLTSNGIDPFYVKAGILALILILFLILLIMQIRLMGKFKKLYQTYDRFMRGKNMESMEETVPKVKGAADVTIVGLMVSLNRMEVGKGGEKCALDEVKDLYGFETAAIVTMEDVVECLYNKECDGKVVIDDELKAAIDAYYEKYGAK